MLVARDGRELSRSLSPSVCACVVAGGPLTFFGLRVS